MSKRRSWPAWASQPNYLLFSRAPYASFDITYMPSSTVALPAKPEPGSWWPPRPTIGPLIGVDPSYLYRLESIAWQAEQLLQPTSGGKLGRLKHAVGALQRWKARAVLQAGLK